MVVGNYPSVFSHGCGQQLPEIFPNLARHIADLTEIKPQLLIIYLLDYTGF